MLKKKEAIDYAVTVGWTKADADRAFESLKFPVEQCEILNAMVRFAGPELLERQRKQAAQKAQVTTKKKLIESLEKQYEQMVQDYETQIASDRSGFTILIKTIYKIASRFGYQDPWIESLIATYDHYTSGHEDKFNSNDNQGKAA